MTPSTASQSSLKLTRYLTGATGVAAFLAAPQADAAVVAVQFEFGPVAYATNSVGFYLPYVTSTGGSILDKAQIAGGFGYVSLATLSIGANPFFNEGTYANFASSSFPTGAYRTSHYFGTGSGDELNRNIFFTTLTNNYSGWANVTWNETVRSLTFNSAYLETDSSKGITIGDVGAVPEPSRALLMLAGLGGVALRRRRKLVA